MAIDALLELPPALPHERPARADLHRTAADLAVLAALGWWATYLTWGTGGREPHVLSIGLGLVTVAAALTRPWRLLTLPALVLGLSVAAAAFLVTLVAPTGWRGANEASSWVYAVAMTLTAGSWAREVWRREALLLVLALGPLLSFARGWTAWWGGEDSARPFIGTFYWHNQEGSFLALGVLAALALAVTSRRVLRYVGWLAVAVCGAGVVVSTSRASMGALGLGLLVFSAAALAARAWVTALAPVLAGLLIAATSFVLTGPPFFPGRSTPLAGTTARTSDGQSLAANGGHRLDDWKFAGRVFRHWPLSGTGFHGFASGSARIDAGHGSLTPFAHNGYLQVLVDGGLLLAVPVLLALGLLGYRAVRAGIAARQSRDWRVLGALSALIALAAHSGVDFDWSYPSLLSAFGLTAALAVPLAPAGLAGESSRLRRGLGACVLGLLVLAACAAWQGGLVLNVPVGSHS